jgi:hypothetical protein
MEGRIVDATGIARDAYRVSPPHWVVWSVVLFFVVVDLLFFLQPPKEMVAFKWPVVAVLSLVLVGLLRVVFRENYLVTLVADGHGLYFQLTEITKYFFVPWEDVRKIEKAIFPVNKRGLRVSVDCRYWERASRELGNARKERGECFIYTIPQLRNRDSLIKKLESFRPR